LYAIYLKLNCLVQDWDWYLDLFIEQFFLFFFEIEHRFQQLLSAIEVDHL
jgi:hypothetical protein